MRPFRIPGPLLTGLAVGSVKVILFRPRFRGCLVLQETELARCGRAGRSVGTVATQVAK
jgi:hypothetical protein